MSTTLAEVDKVMFRPLVLDAVKELGRMRGCGIVQYYEVRALVLSIGDKARSELPRELQKLVLSNSKSLADEAALERVSQGLVDACLVLK